MEISQALLADMGVPGPHGDGARHQESQEVVGAEDHPGRRGSGKAGATPESEVRLEGSVRRRPGLLWGGRGERGGRLMLGRVCSQGAEQGGCTPAWEGHPRRCGAGPPWGRRCGGGGALERGHQRWGVCLHPGRARGPRFSGHLGGHPVGSGRTSGQQPCRRFYTLQLKLLALLSSQSSED